MQDISFEIAPIPGHAFFKKPQFQCLLGNDFFQFTGLAAKVFNFACRSRPSRITGKSALASFHKLLRPFVINTLGNTFTTAKLGDGFFTA